MPAELGEKLLMVDGSLHSGGLAWIVQARVLADEPSVVAKGESVTRTYKFDGSEDPGGGQCWAGVGLFDLAMPRPTLVVIGAGHVAQPIAQVGRLLDFEVIVVDDRPSFANADGFRMPTASSSTISSSALDDIEITPSTYVVLVTRGAHV